MERDMERTVFSRILERLNTQNSGFRTAVFYDSLGETIDYFSHFDAYDTRLTAAHLGVVMSLAKRGISRPAADDINLIEIFAEKYDSATVTVAAGLYISVVYNAGELDSKVLKLLERLASEVCAEAGML